MKNMKKRGVGYCTNAACEKYSKGVFLLNMVGRFQCVLCTKYGTAVKEHGFASKNAGEPFKEVRVEFNYDPVAVKYQETAIVRDNAMSGACNMYTLFSPIVKTETRALKVAEAILANLQCYPKGFDAGLPGTSEIILSFDAKLAQFSEKLELLGIGWQNSNLVQR